MTATCTNCAHSIEPDVAQQALIAKLKGKGAPVAMLKCPKCWRSFSVDLQSHAPAADVRDTWRCPVPQCTGWVSRIGEGDAVWACGECGSEWKSDASLRRDIETATARFPYRAPFYEGVGDSLRPSLLATLPDYFEKVEGEPPDDHPGYEHG